MSGPTSTAAHAPDRFEGELRDTEMLRRLWEYVTPYRAKFLVSLIFLVGGSASLLVQPYLLKVAIDQYVTTGDLWGLSGMAMLFLGAVVLELGFVYGQYVTSMEVAQNALADLRVAIFAHIQRLPMRYFDRHPVGRLVTRLTTDVDVVNEVFAAGALTIFMDVLTLVGIIVILFLLDPWMAGATCLVLPVLGFAINFFRVRARVYYRTIRERIARINAMLQESISGMTVIQLFAREEESFEDFDRRNDAHRAANHRSNVYEAALFSLVEAFTSITIALVVWVASGRIEQGWIAFGTLVAFVEYIQKFFVPIRDFSAKYAVMQSALAAGERVFALLDTSADSDVGRVHESASIEGRATFDRVGFAYRGDERVLRDVSFEVRPGEKIAIVGATGSGKTTLVKLLAGLYDAQDGSIRVDGVDVREWSLRSLRSHVGMVLQDVTLFTGTIFENVSLNRPDVTRERVRAALEAVRAWPFVSRLPGTLDAEVRERGNNFSTGQRQLLSFARALVLDPEILVLDEATSSVDPETEHWVQEGMERVLAGRTAIVIAHRLSTIERVDRIVVLHHGEVREVGTHDELLRSGGVYARLHRIQFGAAPAALTGTDRA